MVLGDVWIEALGVQKNGVAAYRLDDRDIPVDQQLAQVTNLVDAAANMIVLTDFLDADGHSFHITAGHATIGVQILQRSPPYCGQVEHVLVIDGQPAADIDQIVFFSAHPGAIGVTAELLQDGRDRLVGISFSRSWMKKAVFDHAGGVQVDANAVLVAQFSQGTYVGHADRLPPAILTVPARLI